MKKSGILLFVIICLCFLVHKLSGQVYDFDSLYKHDIAFKQYFNSELASKDIFESDEVIKVIIESDFKKLVKNKIATEEQPAIFKYFLNDTIVVNRNITIKPRGNVRRTICYFPPIKLNFKKKEVVLSQLKQFDKMKMVLECKRGKMYEQYLLSEYLVYKLFNIITEYSFRVRLIHVTYVDTSEKIRTATQYAFIIESEDQLADRLNAVPINTKHIRDQYTDLPSLADNYLFQYLIGHTDWSIPGRHNIKMIKSNDHDKTKPYVIPYDFDYAGIINTIYAVPDERLGIKSVRERVYRGVCINESYIKSAAEKFIKNKQSIYSLYNSFELMEKGNLYRTIEYLDEFYSIIERERGLQRQILEQCRK